MEITHYQKDHIFIVAMSGSFSNNAVNEVSAYMRPIINEVLLNRDMNGMIIDMEAVKVVDSTALGFLAGKVVKFKKAKKKIALCCVHDNIYRALEQSGLHTAFWLFATVMEAVHLLKNPDFAKETVILDEPMAKKKQKETTKKIPKFNIDMLSGDLDPTFLVK